MTKATLELTQEFLKKNAGRYDLYAINLDPGVEWLHLAFRSGFENEPDVIINLLNIIFLNFSRTANDEKFYFVGNWEITPLEKSGKDLLSKVGYDFKLDKGIPNISPDQELYYFQVEGGIMMQIVCVSFEILGNFL